uniref:CCDC66 domain-containing protein n=1 Tax=Macrostomum lignano TaxID=282301 RepID=A0A1I8IHL2_9PLAT
IGGDISPTPGPTKRCQKADSPSVLIAQVQPSYSMSDDSEQRQQPAPAAFQVPVDEENIAQTGGRRPRHLEQRMEDREGITAEVMTRRQAEAEERRKRKEAETIKRVSMHHEKVDKISKDAEDRKKRESVS